MRLVYCGNGNPRLAQIAISAGFAYGCQLPGRVMPDANLFFADQDWKKPNRVAYMTALEKHRPSMATVLDWEHEPQLQEVLNWAEEAAQWVSESVVIIPKIVGSIDRIPKIIGGKRVVLGYSVPTKFGATSCPCWEFTGRAVHLLGGSPHRQMREWAYLACMAEVVSADGNMSNLMATRSCKYWDAGKWVPLKNQDGDNWGADAPYECFRRSCQNIKSAWGRIGAEEAPC